MGWTIDPVAQSVLFHYSEDPEIRTFEPHVPRTNPDVAAAVWAIDPAHAALYWFPRACPRVTVWANDASQQRQLQQAFATSAWRVQAAPRSWSDAIHTCKLFEYRFDPEGFDPWPEAEGQWVASRRVSPLSSAPVGDLVARHRDAGVELRLVDDLRPIRDAVVASGLPFSVVRYASADPPSPPA